MGEVYRATDTNLGRDVAIKVLPDALAHDSDRLARFEREARTLASLNHPNIAIVHGLERSEGSIGLVMELVEGQTLADRIVLGAIPVEDALPIARQIAEALESAHEHGIVHRDLKPANVKVRFDGTVKVLDFGLAKAIEASQDGPAHGPAALSLSPTITSPAMTQAGIILGTAAYMSPEQARGTQADRRADIWALGCVVFEMLTGRAVFEGQTVSDVLAGVLRAEPDWTRLPAAIHPRVRSMLERCLARDVRNRYQGVGDARVDIEAALLDPRGAAIHDSSRGPRPGSTTRVWLIAAAALALGAAMAFLTDRLRARDTAAAVRALRLDIGAPADGMITTSEDEGTPFALSPNGRLIATVARQPGQNAHLWVRALDAERAQPLAGTENATGPFWSPDSEWIAFYANASLKKVRWSGGEPQTITETRSNGTGGSAWSPNGTILFKSGRFESPFVRISAQGGSVTPATRFEDGENTHVWPSFLPDGVHFVYRSWGGKNSSVYVASLEGGDARLLLSERNATERGLAWASGFLLFMRDGALVARRLDDRRLEVMDEESRLVDNVPALRLLGSVVRIDRRCAGLLAKLGRLRRGAASVHEGRYGDNRDRRARAVLGILALT